MSVDGLILNAARIAQEAHKEHKRKYSSEPYIMHPMRVAGCTVLLPNAGPVEIAAAWLHDVIEMCPTFTERELMLQGIPTIVIDLVLQLSNASRFMAPSSTRKERKKADFEFIAGQSLWARKIKLLDRYDNVSKLSFNDMDWMRIYVEETKELLKLIGNAHMETTLDIMKMIEFYEAEMVRLELGYGWGGDL